MAVALNNTNTMVDSSGATTYTTAFSVTAGGSNIVAFAVILVDGAGLTINSVTYAGAAMTAAGAASTQSSNNLIAQVFYKINPATGSNNLVVTTSALPSQNIYMNLVSFTGVSQTTPVRSGTYQNPTNPSSGAGATFSMTVTSNVSDLTLTAIHGGTSSAIPSTNQTLDSSNGLGTYSAASDHATTAASSVTHIWNTTSINTPIAIVGFSIQAVAAGATVDQIMSAMDKPTNTPVFQPIGSVVY